jgi:molybdopterin-biosynthesis enzyme MoeA-like protein
MGTLIRSLALLLVFTLSSRAVQTDKQLERLQKEKSNLTRQTDPVGRTKTEIKISEALLNLISDAVQAGDMELMQKYIAEYLTAVGIDLTEVRVVGDEEDAIVDALNALRHRYTYVFTTGGIGPTHDDITADCVAKAFGVTIDVDPRARALLLTRIKEQDLNEARLRMARIPACADLILNKVSAAPGFRIGNVHVMAGVPSIMQAMLDEVAPTLKTGVKMLSETVRADLREGDIGTPLAAVAKAHPEVTIGSYPFQDDRGPNSNIVVRSRDPEKLAAAKAAVEDMLAGVRAGLRRTA